MGSRNGSKKTRHLGKAVASVQVRHYDTWIMVIAVEMLGRGQIWLLSRQSLQGLLMDWMWEVKKIKDSQVNVRF